MRGGICAPKEIPLRDAPKVSIPIDGEVPLVDKGACISPCSLNEGFPWAGEVQFSSALSGFGYRGDLGE